MTKNTTAAQAGRIVGTVYAHTRRTVELIDWHEVAQIVWHGLITLAVMTYLAGEFTGRTLHQLNDMLSNAWRRLWVPEAEVSAKPTEQPILQPIVKESTVLTMPVLHPLAVVAAELQSCTSSELRRITGSRRRCSKAELVAAYVAA